MKKTPQQIQFEIAASAKLALFSITPRTIECWNEHGILWRTDNGLGYTHVIQITKYQFHLLYFDGQLAIVEKNGTTIFSHLTPELAESMASNSANSLAPKSLAPRTMTIEQLAQSHQLTLEAIKS
jgi:hypothetical protein